MHNDQIVSPSGFVTSTFRMQLDQLEVHDPPISLTDAPWGLFFLGHETWGLRSRGGGAASRGNFSNPAQTAAEVYEARRDDERGLGGNVPGNFVLSFCLSTHSRPRPTTQSTAMKIHGIRVCFAVRRHRFYVFYLPTIPHDFVSNSTRTIGQNVIPILLLADPGGARRHARQDETTRHTSSMLK